MTHSDLIEEISDIESNPVREENDMRQSDLVWHYRNAKKYDWTKFCLPVKRRISDHPKP
jgi:hypothetical protein